MELITAIVLAGPLGYFAPNRRLGLLLYLAVWAIVLPIQTVVVHSENPDDINWPIRSSMPSILAGGSASTG